MKINNKKTAIIIIILIVSVFIVTGTLAKYVYNSVWSYYLTSKGFYFESDFLTLDTKKTAMLDWDGSDISFFLKNSKDSFVSEFDISYKVSCDVLGEEAKYLTCNLNNTEKNSFEGVLSSTAKCINKKDQTDVSKYTKAQCEVGGYIWSYDTITKENTFNLVSLDATKDIDEASVKITVESTKPYKKVLSGVFNLNKREILESTYEVDYQSFAEYDELTIINKTNSTKCFLIGFDSNEYLLNTLENSGEILEFYTDSNDIINGFDISVDKENSGVYSFYKKIEGGNYSIDHFVVSEKEC